MKQADIEKYLRKNPAPSIELAGTLCAVVIPVYDEMEELPEMIIPLLKAVRSSPERVVPLFVVNEPPGADNTSSLAALEFLKHFPEIQTIYAPGLSGGVGAARKLGMDAAVGATAAENMENLVICSLDADTWVAENYFSCVIPAVRQRGGAVTIGFTHRRAGDSETERAVRVYETYQRRYVELLRKAGSPYAFFTVGSAFAVSGSGYIRSGGMRVKKAGEDFYFLQAAAKRCGVSELPEILLFPSPRISRRVPFGTGRSVEKLLDGGTLDELPDSAFDAVKQLLDCAYGDAALKDPGKAFAYLPDFTLEFLRKEEFFTAWEKVLKNLPDSQAARRRAFNEWFDGLKTLRFMHFFVKYYTFKG